MNYSSKLSLSILVILLSISFAHGFSCFGVNSASNATCFGHGTCTATDTCSCKSGWIGSMCQIGLCFGIRATDISVCSGNGVCQGNNTCVCYDGYETADCSIHRCGGVSVSAGNGVCNGHGTCSGPNTCECSAGYAGSACQFAICYGVAANFGDQVCNGNGDCVAPDTCSCKNSHAGDDCGKCKESSWGSRCVPHVGKRVAVAAIVIFPSVSVILAILIIITLILIGVVRRKVSGFERLEDNKDSRVTNYTVTPNTPEQPVVQPLPPVDPTDIKLTQPASFTSHQEEGRSLVEQLERALKNDEIPKAQGLIKEIQVFVDKHGTSLTNPDVLFFPVSDLLESPKLLSIGQEHILGLLRIIHSFSILSLFNRVQEGGSMDTKRKDKILKNLEDVEKETKKYNNEDINIEILCIRESMSKSKQAEAVLSKLFQVTPNEPITPRNALTPRSATNDWYFRLLALRTNVKDAKTDASTDSLQEMIGVIVAHKHTSTYEETYDQLNILQDIALTSDYPKVRSLAAETIVKHFSDFQDQRLAATRRVSIRKKSITALGRLAAEKRDEQVKNAATAAITERALVEEDEDLRNQTAEITKEANINLDNYALSVKQRLESHFEKLESVKSAIQENKSQVNEIEELIKEREKELTISDGDRHIVLQGEIEALRKKADELYYDKQRRFNQEWEHFVTQSSRFRNLLEKTGTSVKLNEFKDLKEAV